MTSKAGKPGKKITLIIKIKKDNGAYQRFLKRKKLIEQFREKTQAKK
jgi:hypothetical protein